MTAPDAPQAEPLTLTLEEALAKLGERGYTLAVHHHEDAPREYVLHDVYSAFPRGSFGHWKDAVEAVLGVPVVPRDDTAELAEAAERYLRAIDTAKQRRYERLLATTTAEVQAARDAQGVASREAQGARKALDAALARVKGGELGEGWGEPYAHRDPGKGRPARTARNTRGER